MIIDAPMYEMERDGKERERRMDWQQKEVNISQHIKIDSHEFSKSFYRNECIIGSSN